MISRNTLKIIIQFESLLYRPTSTGRGARMAHVLSPSIYNRTFCVRQFQFCVVTFIHITVNLPISSNFKI